jgi:succinate-semialdehyde dehydrogenase/glutarate-semialdehyde dehydrogenase
MVKNYGLLIDGKWVENKKTLNVLNPFNLKKIASVSIASAAQITNAIQNSQYAFRKWSRISVKDRSQILKNLFRIVKDNKKLLSEIITMESGKPLSESMVEVDYGASFIEWAAEQSLRSYGKIFESPELDKKMFYIRKPVGVVAAITPWNFPLAMVTRKVAAAIAAGCSIILKPSELTPLTALKFGELAIESGIPNGVFNIINGDAQLIGKLLTESSIVKKITFTGSTKVGKLLMKNSSSTVKNISLELGGNAPFIVFDDANLDEALEGFIAAKFRNAGQTCISANRLFVNEKVFEKFQSMLVNRFKQLRVGNGLDDVDVGPLISNEALKKVESHIKDAVKKGAKLVFGGKRSKAGELFFEPTLVGNIDKQMQIFKKENFGPIIPLIKFKSEKDLIELVNDTEYGLAAYFYTNKTSRIWQIVENLEYGMFGVNSGKISTYLNPFGGLKESGIGREGSLQCLEPFLETKFISWRIND